MSEQIPEIKNKCRCGNELIVGRHMCDTCVFLCLGDIMKTTFKCRCGNPVVSGKHMCERCYELYKNKKQQQININRNLKLCRCGRGVDTQGNMCHQCYINYMASKQQKNN